MINTKKYVRKPLFVQAVRVTDANFEEIAAWCQGEIIVPGVDDDGHTGDKRYIQVRVHNPKNPRQTKAFTGDWLLYTERGYKVYTNKAFHGSFDEVEYGDKEFELSAASPAEGVVTQVEARVAEGMSPQPGDEKLELREEEPPVMEAPAPVPAPLVEPPAVTDQTPEVDANEAVSEMAQAKAQIEADGGTLEEATPEAIADVVRENTVAEGATADAAAGKRVLSVEEQSVMDQSEVRDLIRSGEAVLAQDLV